VSQIESFVEMKFRMVGIEAIKDGISLPVWKKEGK
jgi:hypothetical protein